MYALAPLTNTQSHPDGTLSDDELRWLVRRAGHFDVIETCATFVSAEGHAWRGQLGISSDAHLPGLTRLASAIAAAGSIGLVQLHHAGKQATLAPQKLSTVDGDGVRGATEADIARVIGDFVAAALRAERAGFGGVEVHGANGYLFTQFLAPADNPRTDAYGGDLVGRARFLREAVRAVRAAVSPGFLVGVRISPVDVWSKRGLVLADAVQLAAWLAEDGVDFLHASLSDASGSPPHEDVDTPVVTALRAALPDDVRLLAAGGIWTRADADRARAAGVDVPVLGRAAIAHPDWPQASLQPDFTPMRSGWTREHLQAVDVGPAFIQYLSGFPGLVEGGRPAERRVTRRSA